MRFKNDGPLTLYVVMSVEYGRVVATFTNKKSARDWMRKMGFTASEARLLSYDQRTS